MTDDQPDPDRIPDRILVFPSLVRSDLRRYGPVVTQLIGVAALAVGFGMVAIWAGLVAGGAGLLAFGIAAEMGD